MYCANHETVESVTLCHACGKAICAECRHDLRGVNYCPDCLAEAIERVKSPVLPPKTPGLAGVLAFIPGVGAIYNGQYTKAIAFIAVFAGLIVSMDRASGGEETFLGLLMAAYIFYMIVDSIRSAKLINERAAGQPPQPTTVELPGGAEKESLTGGIVILIVGVLFQLRNFGLFSFGTIWRLWPLIIIVVGIIMLRNYFASQKEEGGKNV